jgi:regulator of protease activity HflC (stomatin/prohibitin superfamily)
MKTIKLIAAFAILALSVGCTQQVPPAHLGKVLTPSGYSPDVYPPSRVSGFGPFSRDTLILLETGTQVKSERMKVIMADKLTLIADVKFRTRIAGNQKAINAMFNDIVPVEDRVTLNSVYAIYGKMLVRNKGREILSSYTVEDVHKNYARISSEIHNAMTDAFAGIPLEISDVALGNIQYPAVVTAAVEKAAERKMAIEQEKNQALIDMVKKQNAEKLAQADYRIEMIKAKTLRDANKTIGDGVTPMLIQYKALEVQAKMAENKNAVFMPYDALGSIGAQTRMYSK